MIIGRGLIAKAFHKYYDRKDVVIFASGVSNSLEKNSATFLREQKLLKKSLKIHRESLFVYFGTCSVYDPSLLDSDYVKHKREMEDIVREASTLFIICRLPQVVGRSNNNATLLNYLYNNIAAGRTFDLWSNAIRYIVDIDDVVRFVSYVIGDTEQPDLIVNLTTLPSKVLDIVKCLEKIIGRKAIYNLIAQGMLYSIPVLDSDLTAFKAGIVVDENYLDNVLVKYYKGFNC